MNKRKCYIGYNECYLTETEIKQELKYNFKRLKDNTLYRVFKNEFFYKVFDFVTDKTILFWPLPTRH